MNNDLIGSQIIRLDRVDSTNNYVKRLLPSLADGTVVIAAEQTDGRGRGQHSWFTSREKGLAFSIRLSASTDRRAVPFFNIFPAVAIVDCLRSCGVPAQIKWPNDIIAKNRKVGGILVESSSHNGVMDVILGIGLNLNEEFTDFPVHLGPSAGSLKSITGQVFDPKLMLKKLLKFLNQLYQDAQTGCNWPALRDKWNSYCNHLNQTMYISRASEMTEGKFLGIDESGFAVIKTKDMTITVRDYSHVSLR